MPAVDNDNTFSRQHDDARHEIGQARNKRITQLLSDDSRGSPERVDQFGDVGA